MCVCPAQIAPVRPNQGHFQCLPPSLPHTPLTPEHHPTKIQSPHHVPWCVSVRILLPRPADSDAAQRLRVDPWLDLSHARPISRPHPSECWSFQVISWPLRVISGPYLWISRPSPAFPAPNQPLTRPYLSLTDQHMCYSTAPKRCRKCSHTPCSRRRSKR